MQETITPEPPTVTIDPLFDGLAALAAKASETAQASLARGYEGPSIFGSARQFVDALDDLQIEAFRADRSMLIPMVREVADRFRSRPGAVLVEEVNAVVDELTKIVDVDADMMSGSAS